MHHDGDCKVGGRLLPGPRDARTPPTNAGQPLTSDGRQNLRGEVRGLQLRLPDAGGDDHRPLEPVFEKVPVLDVLLRPEELRDLPGGVKARGSRA